MARNRSSASNRARQDMLDARERRRLERAGKSGGKGATQERGLRTVGDAGAKATVVEAWAATWGVSNAEAKRRLGLKRPRGSVKPRKKK